MSLEIWKREVNLENVSCLLLTPSLQAFISITQQTDSKQRVVFISNLACCTILESFFCSETRVAAIEGLVDQIKTLMA